MSRVVPKAAVALVALALILTGFLLWPSKEGPEATPLTGPADAPATSPTARAESASLPPGMMDAALRTGLSGEERGRALVGLKARLAAMPRDQAVAAIRAQLASGRDAPTGLGFKVGEGGALAEAPSLRVFLLEELARLDPAAAAVEARKILANRTSAEEWAVALRNLARAAHDDADRALLEGKLRELLTYEPWQREASSGYLQAFDVAVHLGGTNLVPELAALVRRTDNRAVSRAAYLALDRLTIETPGPLLARLAEDPELMAGREVTRANYFARADVSDAGQRAALERYLLDPRRTPEELKTFVGLYPNANFMVSQNLLTPVNTPDHAALVARDQAALRALAEWKADPRFASLRPQLDRAITRLAGYVRQ